MFPAIHFNYMEARNFAGQNGKELNARMEKLRKAIKKAAGYTWDNDHFYINNIFGKPCLIVQFDDDGTITFWILHNGVGLGSFPAETLKRETVDEFINNSTLLLSKCQDCGKWTKIYISYSFAGGVCKDCYDPKKHLPPNTSGS